MDAVVDGIHVKRLHTPYKNAMSSAERIRSFIRFMVKSSYVAARTDADVIYASSTPLTVAVPGIVGKFARRVPMVFEVRDLWPSVPIELGYLNNPVFVWMARLLEKLAYKNSATVVALSPGMRDGVLEVTPEKEVVVIPNACDFERFDKSTQQRQDFRDSQGWTEDESVVVYAGGLGPSYQTEWIVELAAELRDSTMRFIILGQGKDSEKLHQLAVQRGLDPEQILLGEKSKEEVSDFVSAGDIVMSTLLDKPSLQANSLNKVFDGLSAGRPIVLNHKGWLTEAVVEANAGLALDRSIPKAAAQLREYVADPATLEEAGKNSAALGRSRFDRNELFQSVMQVLEKAVKA